RTMGLDASVRCRCFEEGRYSKPPFPICIDEESGFPALQGQRTPEEESEFERWLPKACEHGEMMLAFEWISNWSWVNAFHRLLHAMPERTPRLLSVLPTENSGLVAVGDAEYCLAELDSFERTFHGELVEVLDQEDHFRVVAFLVANGDGHGSWENGRWEVGTDVEGVYFRQRSGARQVLRPGAERVGEDERYVVVIRRAAEFTHLLEPLRIVLQASVDSGNPVRWS
ncbi:MAG: hypothetical protein KC492_26730, partial [Myxococcales bacterium]|nr:hypothetical protein [Myxococcales bacterium]